MKKIISLASLAAIVLLSPQITHAEVGGQSFGITNTSFAAGAGATLLGQNNVQVNNRDFAQLVLTGTAITTNASTVSVTIARVDADGNIENSAPFIWQAVTATTGAQAVLVTNSYVIVTNLSAAYIGATYSLRLVNMTNNSLGGSFSSPVLKAWQKDVK